MTAPPDVMIRPMAREEMDLAVRWAAEEGWNPGVHDAEAFYDSDPTGFFVAEKDGAVAGTVSLVSYAGDLSFAGFLVVRPDLRGQGIGAMLIRHMLECGKDRNIGGDGVPAMLPTYLRKGFRFAYWNHRFKGLGGGEPEGGLSSLAGLPFEELVRYDGSIFPAPRERFLRAFLAQEDTTVLISQQAGRIDAYGAIRRCLEGHKIGPLFADNRAAAEKVLRGLVSTVPGEPYFLDVPEPNADGMAMARDLSLTETFRTARIYTKQPPVAPLHRMFGNTSFELG